MDAGRDPAHELVRCRCAEVGEARESLSSWPEEGDGVTAIAILSLLSGFIIHFMFGDNESSALLLEALGGTLHCEIKDITAKTKPSVSVKLLDHVM
jgi:hypothetical protein